MMRPVSRLSLHDSPSRECSTRRVKLQSRTAFTLVELLVVITIITLLSATMVVALAGAHEQAREARTRSQIAKLHEMLTERYESYRTRAVPLRISAGTSPQSAANTRLNALRELMRMEMPDRFTDIIDGPVSGLARPALSRAYLRRYNAVSSPDIRFQNAECLYMIVAAIRDGDTTGLDFFKPAEIGDADGDGLPEILDGWGTPIEFLRWTPGLQSPLQDKNPATARDPFDPLGLYPNNYAIFPLVVSAGADRQIDIVLDDFDPMITPPPIVPMHYKDTNMYPPAAPSPPSNNPYTVLPTSGRQIGERFTASTGYEDNIDNHNRDVR